MAAKRIYQIAKEFECEEKKIIDFLTGQGIKVGNRLSAVSEDTYNLLKTKLFAPPPGPVPEPKPEPVAEKPAQVAPVAETAPAGEVAPPAAPGKKKKKKKKKSPQADGQAEGEDAQEEDEFVPSVNFDAVHAATQVVMASSLVAGNNFLSRYRGTKRQIKESKSHLSRSTDIWGLVEDIKFDDPDSSPILYWQAVNKLTTKAYKLLQEFGLKNRELMAEMREMTKNVGSEYVPQEIFTDEENQKFAAQQKVIFEAFGHGMGKVNDNLYELKMYAEEQKRYCEHMSFVDYIKNPESKLERQVPMPFFTLAETILYSVRSVPYHVMFYVENKPQVLRAIENFFAWIDGYKKLKEQGADPAKIEKYLDLEERFFKLVEFMSYDNLIYLRKKKTIIPFDLLLDLLNEYRDNMDDPDAERNFKYKARGINSNLIYKPKEYIFIYNFAGLEPYKDYRTPEMRAEAEARKAAAEAAAAEAAANENAEEQENPAEQSDEA